MNGSILTAALSAYRKGALNVGYIPIPRIECTDDTLDLIVENLTLSGRNLFPNIMQADMRDVAFYFGKKTGIPKVTVHLVSSKKDKSSVFKVKNVVVKTFAHKKEEASATASTASAKNSHFEVVHNKRNSTLSESGHPAGWVNRTTEREDSAAKGADWRSEAFSIVNPTPPTSPTSPTASASPVGTGAA
ncbi:hypothetical protein FIBSPDRAFT_966643 [Athelia psychrophila]|uniref:Uncharacterized protein n=1 Tax=Athelia psychrophila TaxID=1759441 RepID=A0A167WKC7_9AGAM|nr:hypothetical protein FIBSPDRAFT_966643 [Fibularhizoctonia sp. CBS 109695]